jgi:hypothetical protein
MAAPQPYYEIVTGGRPFLLPAQAVVANIDRSEAEMINDEQDRPVGWLTVSYRRVPIFALQNLFPGQDRKWARALVIQVEGGEPVGLAVETVRAAGAGDGVAVEMAVPGNRIPGGSFFTRVLLDGEHVRLILDPERLGRYLHGLPRL